MLLADADPERAPAVESALRGAGATVLLRPTPGESLLNAVARLAPNVVVIGMQRPDRDTLDDLERRGMPVLCGARTTLIRGTEAGVTGVELNDGAVLPAAIVVMAVGIRPNTALSAGIGIAVRRGIVVDDHMRKSDPAIFSVGECVEHRGQADGLVAPLWDMAKICADAMTGALLRELHRPRREPAKPFTRRDSQSAQGRKADLQVQRAGHDAVRREIIACEMKNIAEVMQTLSWTKPDGCHVCRAALNYYLLCAWPGEYVDDAQSRFVNERMHADIQKDGTYSVIPRMWGGLTNRRELRAIADVVDKFAIPEVKVTGGQRIDLLGVKRQDLPVVWRDLNAAGMVSGHAYGKALRTVKTCVGSEWCRFATQNSTATGVALEKMTWGSWHPHKLKITVSGCTRNCAEASIKDFGLVAVESGWELSVDGNGGIHLRGTDALAKAGTPEQVLE